MLKPGETIKTKLRTSKGEIIEATAVITGEGKPLFDCYDYPVRIEGVEPKETRIRVKK